VMLMFNVTGSGQFRGYARLSAERPVTRADTPDQCFDMSDPNLRLPLPVEWIKQAKLAGQAK
jgi:hypothetical protein